MQERDPIFLISFWIVLEIAVASHGLNQQMKLVLLEAQWLTCHTYITSNMSSHDEGHEIKLKSPGRGP